MGAREWVLLAVIVIVPLVIAGAVTLWSLEQTRYRPKAKGTVRTSSGVSRRRRPADVDRTETASESPRSEPVTERPG